MARSLSPLLLAALLPLAIPQQANAQWEFADFSTWVAGTTNQSVTFTDPGLGTVAVSGMTNFEPGYPQYYSETYSNPAAPLVGTIPELWVTEASGQIARVRFDFSVPLTSSSVIILDDVDSFEVATIRAYDSSNSALSLTGWSFSRFDIISPFNATGAPAWSVSGDGLTGTLRGAGAGNSNAWASFFAPTSSQSVSRIDVTIANRLGGFQIAFAQPSLPASAPEPGTLVLLALGGTLVLLKRKNVGGLPHD